MFNNKIAVRSMLSIAVYIICYTTSAFADQDLGTIASNITNTFANIAKLITAAAYLAGFGLTVAALFKFKQHKENPQQVQLGTCVTLLIIGICLLFLPSLISSSGQSIFGASKVAGSVNGTTNF